MPFALMILTITLFLLALSVGSTTIPIPRIIATLTGQGTSLDQLIIWDLRGARALLGFVAGGALALAGLLFQRLSRNPLSSPDALGVLDGAALGAVGFLYLFSTDNQLFVSVQWQPFFAILGAVTSGFVLNFLIRQQGISTIQLIIVGSIMALLIKGIISILLIAGPVYTATNALLWLAGSIAHAQWSAVIILSSALTIVIIILLLVQRSIEQTLLDHNMARSTGLSLLKQQRLMLALAIVLTSLAVCFAGAIGFVGLIAPHIASRLVGNKFQLLLITTLVVGGSMTTAADIIARSMFSPIELPTGALTALIGAPYFLFLLRSRSNRVHV